MAWKIYNKWLPGLHIPVQGTFKTEEDAKLFYRRNKETFRKDDGSYYEPVYVDQKGRG